ncbi:hypothetical protein LVJ94_39740 [Pendulispora rubella]|uniref:Uncharacterized protein n=1 Tax=Pendulispora rubella TaxID=2741070 RepID=A0ABZ2KZ38_9BACT
MSFARWFFVACGASAIIACSSSSESGSDTSNCSCDISYNGAKRTLSCGTNTCLNGVSFTCGKNAAVSQGGQCTGEESDDDQKNGGPPATNDAGKITDAGPAPQPGRECNELRTYCDTKCNDGGTAYAECVKTANEGNDKACVAWQSNNAQLCSLATRDN